MDENKTAKGLILGFVTGGIVGAAIALLYAPKSGRELRSDIRVKKDELLDDTSEYLQIAKTKASDMINEGKRKSEELISDARKKANSLIGDANSILNDAKEKADEVYDIISNSKRIILQITSYGSVEKFMEILETSFGKRNITYKKIITNGNDESLYEIYSD